MQWTGELIDGESGKEDQIFARGTEEVLSIVRKMKDGDSLVLNAQESQWLFASEWDK
jgi:hypothetical protein